jgi:hypothetical protein
MENILRAERKARKDHTCDGFFQIDGVMTWHELKCAHGVETPELPHKIEKGEVYHYQVNKDGGDIYTWKSCKRCYDLINEHGLYDDF